MAKPCVEPKRYVRNNGDAKNITVVVTIISILLYIIFSQNLMLEKEQARWGRRVEKIEDWKGNHDRVIEWRDANQWGRIKALERAHGWTISEEPQAPP